MALTAKSGSPAADDRAVCARSSVKPATAASWWQNINEHMPCYSGMLPMSCSPSAVAYTQCKPDHVQLTAIGWGHRHTPEVVGATPSGSAGTAAHAGQQAAGPRLPQERLEAMPAAPSACETLRHSNHAPIMCLQVPYQYVLVVYWSCGAQIMNHSTA